VWDCAIAVRFRISGCGTFAFACSAFLTFTQIRFLLCALCALFVKVWDCPRFVPPVLKIVGFFAILGGGILTMRKLQVLVTGAKEMHEVKRPKLTLYQKGLLLAATSTVVLGTAFADHNVLSTIFASAELLCWALTFFNLWFWSLRYTTMLDQVFSTFSAHPQKKAHTQKKASERFSFLSKKSGRGGLGTFRGLGKHNEGLANFHGGNNEGETEGETNNDLQRVQRREPTAEELPVQPAQRREPTAEELAVLRKMAKTKQKLKSNMMLGVLASINVLIVYFVLLNPLWIRDPADDQSSFGCTLRESFNTTTKLRSCLGIIGVVAIHLAWIQTSVIFFLSRKDKRKVRAKGTQRTSSMQQRLRELIFKNKKNPSSRSHSVGINADHVQEISQIERSSIQAIHAE
jgi:hypothetical protein